MNALKFPALAIGQRFAIHGTHYVKTSPILARAEDSGQSQVIPRSAQVDLLDAAPTSLKPVTTPAHTLIDDLHKTALTCLETLAKASATPPKALTQARKQLATAFRQARAQLDKNS